MLSACRSRTALTRSSTESSVDGHLLWPWSELPDSDQGCQFTYSDVVGRLQGEQIEISWSGQKRCYDNILVERLWRKVKYVAAGFSAKPSKGVPPRLQRWLRGGDQPGPVPLDLVPCKAQKCTGKQNSPHGLHLDHSLSLPSEVNDVRCPSFPKKGRYLMLGKNKELRT
jgi:transposase InsO family protein